MRSGFFKSIDGDRKYDADDISNYFLKLISNGVFATPTNSMRIQSTGGMKVKINTLKNVCINLHEFQSEDELYRAVKEFAYVEYYYAHPHSYR